MIEWCKVLSPTGHFYCDRLGCDCQCHLPLLTEEVKKKDDDDERSRPRSSRRPR